ncbi:hypothetical protein HJG53_14460 [Sphingomonas sp. ID1715]|uniref:hypothetical protein n=1 Tax=Sphingomonas sp. ID1715 TaxID=1656898 RepID=UPI00148818E1|nr:hypothetical protein [Sphingomonas sp. ID1715]NNM78102.1 hypothetical protein [Sphingomonas sp. ID1715]
MQRHDKRLDGGQAWTDAMALLKGQREILLTVAGFFLLLPMLILLMLRWPVLDAESSAGAVAGWNRWTEHNSLWLLLVAVCGSFGRLAILILILDRSRPSVREALGGAAQLFLWFYLAGMLAGLAQYGGLLLFVIPGLYLVGRLFVVEPALVAERLTNPLRVLARSFEITRGNGWRIFAVTAIVVVGGTIFLLAVSTVVGVFAALMNVNGLELFLSAFICAAVFSGIYLVLLLLSVAAYWQLADQGHVRSGAFG